MSRSGNNEAPADLASILATLAALAPRQAQTGPATVNGNETWNQNSLPETQPNSSQVARLVTNGHQNHAQRFSGQPSSSSSQSIRPIPQSRHNHHTQAVIPESRSFTPPIDPATIIEWPQGLRCVTKIASQNAMFGATIRKMMVEQDRHEDMWWDGRRKLLQSHGHPSPAKRSDAVWKELEAYDLKVYNASKSMVQSMSEELKQLGVPFFGVRSGLVVSTTSTVKEQREGPPPTITPEQLLSLQRKMITHLEDMYKV